MAFEKGRFCVTGAGGFIASWVIKFLLSKDCIVHGTVRDPSDKKNAFLYDLEKASRNLKLFKAELYDYDALYSAMEGCIGVFHIASPVPEAQTVPHPEKELVEPAVTGTLNVLKASLEAKVKRVVFMSAASAVVVNPNWPKDKAMDETCWSQSEHCKKINNWYAVSKTEAETKAMEFAKRTGLDVVAICPPLVLGPILQSKVNASSLFLINLLNGVESTVNGLPIMVDVRDVAEAMLLLYEKPEAKGRYICSSYMITGHELVDKLRTLYPNYSFPKIFAEGGDAYLLNSEKLQKLGWSYRPLEEILVDSIESYKKDGLLN